MKKLLTTMAVALVAATAVRADVLALWQNDDVSGSDTNATVDSTHADISASLLAFGAGLGPAAGWNTSLSSFAHTLTSSLSAAVAANDYFTFTLTPGAGKQVSYSSIYNLIAMNAGGSAPLDSAIEFTLMSSLTGFTASDGLASFIAVHDDATGSGAQDNTHTYDVSGVSALQNVGSAVEFRLYTHTSSGTPNRMAIGHIFFNDGADDLRVDGTVIPEPATLGLVGFFAAGMLWIRRKFAI